MPENPESGRKLDKKDDKKKGREHHPWSAAEDKFLLSISKNEVPAIVEEKYRKNFPGSKLVSKGAVKTRFKALHLGTAKRKGLSHEDRKVFSNMEVRSEPITMRQDRKESEPAKQRLSGTFKKFSIFTDDPQPWLEQFLGGPFVKTEPCMDEMRGEWNTNRFVADGIGLLTSTSQIPDSAFLRYKGNYTVWVPSSSVAALTSAATSNGLADNLVEVTDN